MRRWTPPIGPVFSSARFLLCTFCKEIPAGVRTDDPDPQGPSGPPPFRQTGLFPPTSLPAAVKVRPSDFGRGRAEETLLPDAVHVDPAGRKDQGRAHRPDVFSAHGKGRPVRLVDVNLKAGGQAVAFAEGPQRHDQSLLALIGAAGEVFGPPGPNVRNAVKKRVGHAVAAIKKRKRPTARTEMGSRWAGVKLLQYEHF